MSMGSKRISTKTAGVFYKEIFDDAKVIDKVYGIRWKDIKGISKLKILGKYSEGIREKYCKIKRDEIVMKIRLGEELPFLAKPKQTTTIDEMMKIYFEYKSTTVKDIEKEIARYNNHLKKLIGSLIIDRINENDILQVQQTLTEKLSAGSIRSILVNLNASFKYARQKKLFEGDIPTANIRYEQLNNARERYLTLNEIDKLLEVCYNCNYEVYLFVRLSLSTGGRVGTITTIKAIDFHLQNNSVILSDHKNNDTYTGFYNNDLKTILSNRIAELKSPTDPVLKLHRSQIQYKLSAIMDVMFNQGVIDSKMRVVPHTLRHTFASQLAIASVPILTIQRLMNHKSIEMTLRYAKLSPDQGMNAVLKLYT